jgi:peptide/nickel transport system permease protein
VAILQEVGTSPRPRRSGSWGLSDPTARYVVGRTAAALGTFVFVLVFNFFLFRVMPGDPIALYTRGRNVDAEQIARLRAELNKPLGEQFLAYLSNPFTGNGPSVKYSAPVWDVIGPRIWPTLLLVGTATLLATIIGVRIGIKAGWNRGSRFDKGATNTTLVLYSMPEFWFGMVVLIVFAVGVGPFPGIFPVGGLSTPGVDTSSLRGVLDVAWHLVLPVTTLAVIYLAEYSLVMRASLIEETNQEYVRTARAKGLMDRMVRRRHAVPNALLPTMTLVFLNLGFVVGGAITIETVFSINGLGSLTVDALRGPDVPLLQALFLLFSGAVIFANLVADLLYGYFDPRVRT